MINTTLAREYPAYTISNVNREFYKDKTAYEILLKRDDNTKVVLLVDSDGNIIKYKTKM